VPDVSNFKAARDLAAWIGLTPKPHSSGGKERLGKISKMGNRYIRRLLYLGALATITARRRRPAGDDWLWGDAAKAGEAGRNRAGQPHGADGLGAAQDRRELSGFARLRKNTDPTGPTRWQGAKCDNGELTDNRIGTPRSDRSTN
jgi:hypothetical protein